MSDIRLVRIIDPTLCRECRFSGTAQIRDQYGRIRTVWRCYRKDCDNWETQSGQPVVVLHEGGRTNHE